MESYAAGPTIPLIEKAIPELFAETAARFPEREALVSVHQDIRWIYAELAEQVDRTAAGLWGLGLRPGDRVGMWASSCVEWVLLQVATARIGAVLVNVNPAYRTHDLRYILERSRMKAIFLHERDARADYVKILGEARDGARIELRDAILLSDASWDNMIEAGVKPPAHVGSIHDVVNIQYTSGTTGSPKGVLLSHHNLLNNALLIGGALGWTHEDVLCLPVPLYHCFGCVGGTLVCLVYGAKMVLPSAQFDPLAALQVIDRERATTIYGVPTMFIAELDHEERVEYDLSSLRTGIMAGAPCPAALMSRVVEEMHCGQMTIGYGQTEASPVVTMTAADDSFEVRTSTVGRALPCTDVKIVSPENGETTAVGEQGELCTRGYLVMKGYDGDPEATERAVDADGWLHTGDLATMREDGNFCITGRAKEMIIRGGENIYPREIEEFLHHHPKIADVHVLGLPDERLGERVCAWIRLKPGESETTEEIKEYCRGQIAHFKIPEIIRFVDEFPMTVTGKVQKFEIRRRETEGKGLA